MAALRRALALRQPRGGLLHHTDRGSPYASDAYQALLAEHGIVPSMRRRGDCYDNAVAESFFSTLEHELGGEAKWAAHREAMQAVSEYIDGFYNPTRRHSTIGGLSPIEFERRFRAQPENPGSRGSAPAPPRSSLKDRNQESPEISA